MPLSGAGTTSGLRVEFIPYLMRGRSDELGTFYETIKNRENNIFQSSLHADD